MNNKWFVSVLLIFTVFIVCIGGVSAADNASDNQSASDVGSGSVVSSPQVVDSDDGVVGQENSISDDNQILGDSSDGVIINSSEDLVNVLNDSTVNNTVIYLNNQTFDLNIRSDLSNRNLTFCGGNSLDDDLTSEINFLNEAYYRTIINSSVNFKGIIFYANRSLMDVKCSNVDFDNCLFNNFTINNYIYISFYKSNVTFNNCLFNNIKSVSYTNTLLYYEESNATMNNCKFVKVDNCYMISDWSGSNLTINDSNFISCVSQGLERINMDESQIFINNTNFEDMNINNIAPMGILMPSGGDCNATLNNVSYINNNAIFIYTPVTPRLHFNLIIDNSSFYGNHNSSLYLSGLNDVKIFNSNFINNSNDKLGGAIYVIKGNLSVDNCDFINNSALYGGAIYSLNHKGRHSSTYNPNIEVINSKFLNNSAIFAGGAISLSSNSSFVNNSMFKNNKAGLCGGAIIIANSTKNVLTNNKFTNNNGSGYGNDIYYYYGNLTLGNNGNFDFYNASNHTFNQASVASQSTFWRNPYHENAYYSTYIHYCYFGDKPLFCLEEDLHTPENDVHVYFNNTYIAINNINQNHVGNYLKYLLYNYYGKISHNLMSILIWTFTNREYYNPSYINSINISNFDIFNDDDCNKVYYEYQPLGDPRDEEPADVEVEETYASYISILKETINAVDGGLIIPDSGATKLNDDGSVTVYNFVTLLSPDTQNLIFLDTRNISNSSPDISIIKITNNPVVYKGNDTSFDIVVTNNGTVMLSNVTVTEDSYDDLIYKSSSNINGNWTYSFVNGKHTWTLVGYLGVNQTASFNVVFSTSNSTLGNKTNTVSVTTNENVTGNASNITEVIEKNTTNNNTPNTPENNTPNKPTPVDNGTVENNNTPKADIKTDEATGYPFIPLIIALIGIIGVRTRRK